MKAFMKKIMGCSNVSARDEQLDVVVEIDIEEKPKIQRVPQMLREVKVNQKCYEPLVVSIGPFHHGKKLEITKEHKRELALRYADNDEQLFEGLYNKVKAVARDARNCYSEGATHEFDEEKFTKMMFLDGCFILQFIHCYASDNFKDLKMKIGLAALVRQDLLLLENQVPFQVLKELMSLRFEEADWKKTFRQFIARFRALPDDHIFDHQIQFDQCAHLLDMIQTMFINKAALTPDKSIRRRWPTFRSIQELRAAGIHFRQSESHQWTDVQFRSKLYKGILQLPPLCIDDSTKSMLLNMVAYEACPDAPDDLGVSSYLWFMDSLIDRVEDVQELRSKGILLNYLGSDQQVADLFNEITENLVSNPHAYAEVLDRLEKHYRNKIKIWLAEWLHTHFSSPWTVLAFIGAIIALVLSVIQTYEAIYSTQSTAPTPCPCTVANHTT